jgi:hypothetical protein
MLNMEREGASASASASECCGMGEVARNGIPRKPYDFLYGVYPVCCGYRQADYTLDIESNKINKKAIYEKHAYLGFKNGEMARRKRDELVRRPCRKLFKDLAWSKERLKHSVSTSKTTVASLVELKQARSQACCLNHYLEKEKALERKIVAYDVCAGQLYSQIIDIGEILIRRGKVPF